MYYLVVVLLGIGVFVAYFAGVKSRQRWGTPLLLVCLVGLLVAVGHRAFTWGPSTAQGELVIPSAAQEELRAEKLARLMSGRLPEGAIICVIWTASLENFRARRQAWVRGLKDGLGDEAVKVTFPAWDSSSSPAPPGGWPPIGGDAAVYAGNYVGLDTLGEPLIAVCFTRLPSGNVSIPRHKVQALVDAGDVDVAVWENERGEPVDIMPEE